MDYFQILHLKKEPFSNSPDPAFFYPSIQHAGCLQELELAIRLRRGLNVVIGDVGTGKTTLCRHLVRKFTNDKDIDIYLIFDSGYTSPLEFLRTIAGQFNIHLDIDNDDIWQIKEKIKKYLFNRGVDQKKIITLVFDEGQKLPNFCLESIREFLNYETNDYKLLQIIIFAQKEFSNIIKEFDYFTDRINICYKLKPLNFRDTSKIIRFRLEKASEGRKVPNLFTGPALWNVYKATKGYPRKILHLCHIILLSLIIQNRSKANWFLVQSCIKRDASGKYKKRKSGIIILLFFMVVGILAGYKFDAITIKLNIQDNYLFKALTKKNIEKPGRNYQEIKKRLQNINDDEAKKSFPIILGQIKTGSNETIAEIMKIIYGTYTPWLFKYIQMINSDIHDANIIIKNRSISFPSVRFTPGQIKSGTWWIEIERKTNILEAYNFFKAYPNYAPSIGLLPFWNKKNGLCFSILLKKKFTDRISAINYLNEEALKYSLSGKIIGEWEADTIFFSKLINENQEIF